MASIKNALGAFKRGVDGVLFPPAAAVHRREPPTSLVLTRPSNQSRLSDFLNDADLMAS